MLIIGLIVAQAIAMLVGLGLIWRRIEDLRAEVRQVHLILQQKTAAARRASVRRGEPAFTDVSEQAAETGRGMRLDVMISEWRKRGERELSSASAPRFPRPLPLADDEENADEWLPSSAPSLSPEVARALIVVSALAAPTVGFTFGLPIATIATTALIIAALAALAAVRGAWRHTAWFATAGAGAWAAAGCLAGAEAASAPLYCAGLVAAGGAGLLQARAVRPASPGLGLAALMAAAAMTAGLGFGLIGLAGLAFGAITLFAAAIGATTLRLEPLHLASLVAAGAGLYVMSGHRGADIWFTPVVTLAGMWFLALAFVRVPVLGARGVTLAATGALATGSRRPSPLQRPLLRLRRFSWPSLCFRRGASKASTISSSRSGRWAFR